MRPRNPGKPPHFPSYQIVTQDERNITTEDGHILRVQQRYTAVLTTESDCALVTQCDDRLRTE